MIASLSSLHDQLGDLGAGAELIELTLHPVKAFIEHLPGRQLSYRRIMYVKEVQKELKRLISSGITGDQINEELRGILLYLNYNSIRYFRYFTNHISRLLSGIDSSSGRIEKLSYILKTINQNQVRPGVAYNPAVPRLKDQIADWVGEEIAYLEKVYQLTLKQSMVNEPITDDFKVRTEIPVAQLAYLLRVFVETKVIHNQNLSELMRFVSRFFLTRRRESISYESFRVRYYNTEDSTKRNIRNLLLAMVDYINRN